MENNHEKERWIGSFIPSILKVQRERIGELKLTADAAKYLDKLLIRLLISLLVPVPKTLQDAQDQISRKFPEPLSSDAVEDCKIKIRDKAKKKIHISIDKVQHIVKDFSNSNPEKHVHQFFAAILEYMLSDVLKLTANYVQNISQNVVREEINVQDVKVAMFADKFLVNIFQGDDADDDVPLLPITNIDGNADGSYESLVKNLLAEEQGYLKDLQLIIKFFKKIFTEHPSLFSEADVDLVFCNIEDIAEMSERLIYLLEEAKEMTDDNNPVPLVGNCFEELAEECTFEIYTDYTLNLTDERWNGRFRAILQQASVNATLKSVKVEGFRDMVTYVLPDLLMAPIYHGLNYFEQIQILQRKSADQDDRESFNQTIGATSPIKVLMESRAASLTKLRPSEMSLRISWKGGIQAEKMKEIEESIEGWDGKTIRQSCNEFIYEGDLTLISAKRNPVRRIFLFDSLLVCCKPNQFRRPMPGVNATREYRLKEKVLLRKMTIQDVEGSFQFIVVENEKKDVKYTFGAQTSAEKMIWMTHLVRLQHRSTYDRMLDQLLKKEAAAQPLKLPTSDVYRFAEPDTDDNLVIDEEKSIPIIKGGTVRKLVERLTYHKYFDSSFMKTFLTTFRSFCKPSLFLDLLIERFKIPEPPPTPEQQTAIDRGESIVRDDLKRFKSDYMQPIQLRVVNVIRHWVELHWYDFQAAPRMLTRVEAFVASVRDKNMQRCARSITNAIAKKRKQCEEDIPPFSFEHDPPTVEWHVTHDKEKFSITTLHPIEIARQLTLLEFDLYRKVQPSELVGTVWTKSGKEENSPNLLRMIHCSTTITRWLCRSIVETKNFEERCAVMSRAIEIMQVLKQLNNFNGMLEFVAAFNSSAIHRLSHTKQHLPDRLSKILNECMALCDPRLTKCLEKLRSCDPPCVPFVGTFLTNILKTEEGNPHLLPNYPEHLELINFAKRRMVASILFDIQQYQNQPYNFRSVPEIQHYLTHLHPFEGFDSEKQFNDYIYHCSLEVEPRQAERPARFGRTLTDKEIKSPGIVPSKKSNKNLLYRDESKISLLESRSHASTEEPSSTVRTPETPITPIEKEPATPPPSRPPRAPLQNVTTAPSNNIFSFDVPLDMSSQQGFHPPIEEEDAPPPLPPRDDIPLRSYYVEAEPESFHNEDMLQFHHPMQYPYGHGSPFNFDDFRPSLSHMELNNTYPQSAFSYPTPEPQFTHMSGFAQPYQDDLAPPVPPREPLRNPSIPPAIPPRDPPPYDSAGLRYVADPTRYALSRFSASSDTPPPVPRRQPSAPNF